jgi:hypothetical protein
MHLTEKNLIKIIEGSRERPTWAALMKSIGASERQAYEWRNKSIAAEKKGDKSSPFYLLWNGSGDYWHNHIGRARSEQLISYEALIRDQAANGVLEVVHGPDQKILYRERPEFIGRDDDWIRIVEGLDADVDVRWYRLEHDDNGHPIPLTRRTQLPAPIRTAVLRQIKSYKEESTLNVEHSGVVQVSPALQRLANEPRPKFEELRQLALMTPEQRRATLGAKASPQNSQGLVIAADRGAPRGDDRPDDGTEISKPPNPRAYQVPRLNPPTPTPKSYAKPAPSLDHGERIGHGEPPPGGGPANARGNVRR